MRLKRAFVAEALDALEDRAVPAVVAPHPQPLPLPPPHAQAPHPVPHLTSAAYFQAITDIQAAYVYDLPQQRNPILGTIGPFGPLRQDLQHAIRVIPYHKATGLDAFVVSLCKQLKAEFEMGVTTTVTASQNALLGALYTDVSYLAYTHKITAS